jgi:hypothetical protein
MASRSAPTRLQRSSRLTPADLVAWDLLIVFGLWPAELQGLELLVEEELILARVQREHEELTSYGCRHAFALRLAQHVGHHVREAAELWVRVEEAPGW